MHSVTLLFWSVLFPLSLISSALEYSNRWTVQIDGDNDEANRLARKHGFVNNGKVIDDYYSFIHQKVAKVSNVPSAHLHKGLMSEPNILCKLGSEPCQKDEEMPKLRIKLRKRTTLLHAHYDGLINDEEFLLLYDLNTAKSPDLPYWKYDEFDLEKLSDEECKTEFRFFRNDIYSLMNFLNILGELTCYNGLKCDRSECLCIF